MLHNIMPSLTQLELSLASITPWSSSHHTHPPQQLGGCGLLLSQMGAQMQVLPLHPSEPPGMLLGVGSTSLLPARTATSEQNWLSQLKKKKKRKRKKG